MSHIECLILFCGIPGAGKSTIASKFVREYDDWRYSLLRKKESYTDVTDLPAASEVVSFDDFIKEEQYWDETTFKTSRQSALQHLRSLLEQDGEINVEKLDAMRVRVSGSAEPNKVSPETDALGNLPGRVVAIDDLMYLHSMRHQIYKMGRDAIPTPIPTMVIHVDSDLKDAIARNARRSATQHQKSIPEDTIRKIHAAFEQPNDCNIADRISYTLSMDDGGGFADVGSAIYGTADGMTALHGQEHCGSPDTSLFMLNGTNMPHEWLRRVRQRGAEMLSDTRETAASEGDPASADGAKIVGSTEAFDPDVFLRKQISRVISALSGSLKSLVGKKMATVKAACLGKFRSTELGATCSGVSSSDLQKGSEMTKILIMEVAKAFNSDEERGIRDTMSGVLALGREM